MRHVRVLCDRKGRAWVQAPDRMPFADVARPLLPRLYALARRLVDDGAEDLVQECGRWQLGFLQP